MNLLRNPAIRNIVVLLCVALPFAIVLGWLIAILFPPEWMRDSEPTAATEILAGFAFWYLTLAVPVAIGGGLHQLVLCAIPARWRGRRVRIGIVATAPVVAIGFLFFRHAWGAGLIVPTVLPLLLYGFLARPVRTERGNS